jgi:hypothetical protein
VRAILNYSHGLRNAAFVMFLASCVLFRWHSLNASGYGGHDCAYVPPQTGTSTCLFVSGDDNYTEICAYTAGRCLDFCSSGIASFDCGALYEPDGTPNGSFGACSCEPLEAEGG